MKLALIGHGKTGGEVLKLVQPDETVLVFDRSHPVDKAALVGMDAAIIFVPGTAVNDIFDTVLEAGIASVWGSTGYAWPENLQAKLVDAKAPWVIASNFSPMMLITQKILGEMQAMMPKVLTDFRCHIDETHHIHKQDKPSGTALSWQKWLGLPCEISATREGDIKGIHALTVKTPHETLTIRHEAHDRTIFAEGALLAARYLFAHPDIAPGLYSFYDLLMNQ